MGPVWLNGWVFVYELSSCGFEPCCSQLLFDKEKYRYSNSYTVTGKSNLRNLLEKETNNLFQKNLKEKVFQPKRTFANGSIDFEVLYQDESWCIANHTRECICQNKDDDKMSLILGTTWESDLSVPAGSGKKLIINDKGSAKGLFLEGLQKCFVGVTNSVHYHKEINSAHFGNWWFFQVFQQKV